MDHSQPHWFAFVPLWTPPDPIRGATADDCPLDAVLTVRFGGGVTSFLDLNITEELGRNPAPTLFYGYDMLYGYLF